MMVDRGSVVLHGDLGLVTELMKQTRYEDDLNNEFIHLTWSAHISSGRSVRAL